MAETLPLDPDCRATERADGVPVTLGDGRAWLLADGGLRNALDPVRDRLYDQSVLGGQVSMSDIYEAAEVLLLVNYELDPGELAGLVFRADPQALADAVMLALFGPDGGKKTYTMWAASALLANGVDPATVPVATMPDVLRQLEATGRCVPRGKFVDSAIAAPRLAAARARAAARALPGPESSPEAAPEEQAADAD